MAVSHRRQTPARVPRVASSDREAPVGESRLRAVEIISIHYEAIFFIPPESLGRRTPTSCSSGCLFTFRAIFQKLGAIALNSNYTNSLRLATLPAWLPPANRTSPRLVFLGCSHIRIPNSALFCAFLVKMHKKWGGDL